MLEIIVKFIEMFIAQLRQLILIMMFTLGFIRLCAQENLITLSQSIELAQQNSFQFKVAYNQFQSSLWNFKNLKTNFLPVLSLEGTIPNYSRSITKITLPTGEDRFVNQNQAYSSLTLGIRQNLLATGGVVIIGSTLNRIDVFGTGSRTSYSAIPISISYFQNNIGYNSLRWLKKIETIRFMSSQREYIYDMQEIGYQTVENYFDVISAQTQRKLSIQNLNNANILDRIAKDRFKLGTITQSELLQLRLNVLNAQNKVREDSLSFNMAYQQFAKYLSLKTANVDLNIPDKIVFFTINYPDALECARQNSKAVIEYKVKRLEAEQNLARTKAENNIKFGIQANFGLSNSAPNLPSIFTNLINQQNIAMTFSLPLLDWGYARTQKLRAEASLEMVKADIEQQELNISQEILLQVSKWNIHQKNLEVAIEAKEIAIKNYDLELQRYKSGNISINDLNLAQRQKDDASNTYIRCIKIYWELYYIIRKLTLFDFEKNEKIILSKE